jgi:hypothetical protein
MNCHFTRLRELFDLQRRMSPSRREPHASSQSIAPAETGVLSRSIMQEPQRNLQHAEDHYRGIEPKRRKTGVVTRRPGQDRSGSYVIQGRRRMRVTGWWISRKRKRIQARDNPYGTRIFCSSDRWPIPKSGRGEARLAVSGDQWRSGGVDVVVSRRVFCIRMIRNIVDRGIAGSQGRRIRLDMTQGDQNQSRVNNQEQDLPPGRFYVPRVSSTSQ